MENNANPEEAAANFEQLKENFKNNLDANIAQLQEMGVSLTSSTLATDVVAGAQMRSRTAEQATVQLHWWGIEIDTNEAMTQNIVNGTTATGTVGGFIAAALGAAGVVTGGAATVIGAGLAAIFAIKIAQINIVNNGKGVRWPITWLQWAAIMASIPGGPAAIVAAGAIVIHPLRN